MGFIYVYTTEEAKSKGLLKIGYTSRDVHHRIQQQLNTQGHNFNQINYDLLYETEAQTINFEDFKDKAVHDCLALLNVERIGATEWFKVDLDTVIKAINMVKEYKVPHLIDKNNKKQNTQKYIRRNKKGISSRDRNYLTIECVYTVIKEYPNIAVNNTKIANILINKYNLTTISENTLSSRLCELTRRLIELGLIENKGTFSCPKFQVSQKHINNTKYIQQLLSKERNIFEYKSVNEKDILDILSTSVFSPTSKEISRRLCVSDVTLVHHLEKLESQDKIHKVYTQMINEQTVDNFNGYKARYFLTEKDKKIPKNEIEVEKFQKENFLIKLSKEEVEDVLHALDRVFHKYNYSPVITLSHFCRKTKLNKQVVKSAICKYLQHSRYFLDYNDSFVSYTTRIYNKEHEQFESTLQYYKTKFDNSLKNKTQRSEQAEKILNYLKENPQGVTKKEIKSIVFNNYFKIASLSKFLKEIENDIFSIIENNQGKNEARYILKEYISSSSSTTFMKQNFSDKQNQLFNIFHFSDQKVLDLLAEHQPCTTLDIIQLINKEHPQHLLLKHKNKANNVLKQLINVMVQHGLITSTSLTKYEVQKYVIVDYKKYFPNVNSEKTLKEILYYVLSLEENQYGLNILELASMLGKSKTNILDTIRRYPDIFMYVQFLNKNDGSTYRRVQKRDDEPKCKNNEYGAIINK